MILNAPVDRGLGLVAIAQGNDALAVPVRRERGTWKVEIDPLFTVEAVRPLPGDQVLRRTQLSAEVSAPGQIDDAAMWFDGRFFVDARGVLVAEQAPHVDLGRGATTAAQRTPYGDRIRLDGLGDRGERVGLYGPLGLQERVAVVGGGHERLLDRARADPADEVPHRARLVVRA